jgi:hypothetical protein
MRLGPSAIAVVTALCVSAMPLYAQSAPSTAADEAAIRAVITQLFDGMRARDSVMISGTFAPGVRLVSAGTRKGTLMIDPIGADEFAGVVAKATGPRWDERITSMSMQFDASLAAVWAPYEFWLGDKFSHCGVDAIHLARLPEGWKIIALSDTQRREGCDQGK